MIHFFFFSDAEVATLGDTPFGVMLQTAKCPEPALIISQIISFSILSPGKDPIRVIHFITISFSLKCGTAQPGMWNAGNSECAGAKEWLLLPPTWATDNALVLSLL